MHEYKTEPMPRSDFTPGFRDPIERSLNEAHEDGWEYVGPAPYINDSLNSMLEFTWVPVFRRSVRREDLTGGPA